MKMKCFLRFLGVAVVLAGSPEVVQSQPGTGLDCYQCVNSEGGGFSKCEEVFPGGVRSCRPSGTGCIVGSGCDPQLTSNFRVSPVGRVAFVHAVLTATVDGSVAKFRPVRDEKCAGLVFALSYDEAEAKHRKLLQKRILI